MEAKDLRERLAKALGWRFDRTWLDVEGKVRDLPELDWSIVPVVLADIEARGWELRWTFEADRTWTAYLYVSDMRMAGGQISTMYHDRGLANEQGAMIALVTAYLAAREATE